MSEPEFIGACIPVEIDPEIRKLIESEGKEITITDLYTQGTCFHCNCLIWVGPRTKATGHKTACMTCVAIIYAPKEIDMTLCGGSGVEGKDIVL